MGIKEYLNPVLKWGAIAGIGIVTAIKGFDYLENWNNNKYLEQRTVYNQQNLEIMKDSIAIKWYRENGKIANDFIKTRNKYNEKELESFMKIVNPLE
jgi:hypothetical protein